MKRERTKRSVMAEEDTGGLMLCRLKVAAQRCVRQLQQYCAPGSRVQGLVHGSYTWGQGIIGQDRPQSVPSPQRSGPSFYPLGSCHRQDLTSSSLRPSPVPFLYLSSQLLSLSLPKVTAVNSSYSSPSSTQRRSIHLRHRRFYSQRNQKLSMCELRMAVQKRESYLLQKKCKMQLLSHYLCRKSD